MVLFINVIKHAEAIVRTKPQLPIRPQQSSRSDFRFVVSTFGSHCNCSSIFARMRERYFRSMSRRWPLTCGAKTMIKGRFFAMEKLSTSGEESQRVANGENRVHFPGSEPTSGQSLLQGLPRSRWLTNVPFTDFFQLDVGKSIRLAKMLDSCCLEKNRQPEKLVFDKPFAGT